MRIEEKGGFACECVLTSGGSTGGNILKSRPLSLRFGSVGLCPRQVPPRAGAALPWNQPSPVIDDESGWSLWGGRLCPIATGSDTKGQRREVGGSQRYLLVTSAAQHPDWAGTTGTRSLVPLPLRLALIHRRLAPETQRSHFTCDARPGFIWERP